MGEFWRGKVVMVTGGGGFVGSRLMARLVELGARPVSCGRRTGCDLTDAAGARAYFDRHKPEFVINAAAHQGGIGYQRLRPATILRDNLLMGVNTMEAARLCGAKLYVNLVAGCAYPGEPRDGVLREHEFEAGPMHPTVENYGAAKRAAVALARQMWREHDFPALSLLLINLYGPGEHFHPDRSHGLAALIRKYYEAARDHQPHVTLWGTGRAVREWLYIDDAVEGVLLAAEKYRQPEPLNIAVGEGLTIARLAAIIAPIAGFTGETRYDTTKPDGALRKVADVSRMTSLLGWAPRTPLEEGVRRTLEWFGRNYAAATSDHAMTR